MTLRDALLEAARHIARRDAEVLARHVLARDRAWMLAHPEAELTEAQASALRDLVARRAMNAPLQHLTGTQEFFGRAFEVNGDVLIPRPETELLVESATAWLRERALPAPRILDVGTGSGAIAVTLALEWPQASVTAVDVSPAALAVAQRNATKLGAHVRFLESDLVDASAAEPDGFDAIVSNPPYVALADAPTLAREVVDHEPHLALFAGDDGLAIYRRLIPQAHMALARGGLLGMEIGFGQRDALRRLFDEAGFEDAGFEDGSRKWSGPRFLDDYAGIPRVVLVERR